MAWVEVTTSRATPRFATRAEARDRTAKRQVGALEDTIDTSLPAGVSRALCRYFDWSPEHVTAAFDQAVRTIADCLAEEVAA
jgi:hypothetical protein